MPFLRNILNAGRLSTTSVPPGAPASKTASYPLLAGRGRPPLPYAHRNWANAWLSDFNLVVKNDL